MDSAYRGIVDDCAAAITTVRQRPAGIYQRRSASCVDVTSYWRITAVERKGANERRAVRYLFSNRSEDIHRLFKETCSLIGVECTRPSAKQSAIYRKDSVAILDQFIGPKR